MGGAFKDKRRERRRSFVLRGTQKVAQTDDTYNTNRFQNVSREFALSRVHVPSDNPGRTQRRWKRPEETVGMNLWRPRCRINR